MTIDIENRLHLDVHDEKFMAPFSNEETRVVLDKFFNTCSQYNSTTLIDINDNGDMEINVKILLGDSRGQKVDRFMKRLEAFMHLEIEMLQNGY